MTQTTKAETPLAGDILYGAEAIANFMFGTVEQRRRVYNLAVCGLPVFRLGTMICARKSVLITWIQAQENGGGEHQTDRGTLEATGKSHIPEI